MKYIYIHSISGHVGVKIARISEFAQKWCLLQSKMIKNQKKKHHWLQRMMSS